MSETALPYGARASMEPAGFAVRYRCEGRGKTFAFEADVLETCENEDLVLEVERGDETVRLAVRAKCEIALERLEVRLRHAFASDEKVLLGGYQSWTDTVERPAWGRMRGLQGVPRGVVSRYSLDAMGDYAFADYQAQRGHLHGFAYATFRRGEGVVLVGSLDEARGFTLIETDASQGTVLLSRECAQAPVPVGEPVDVAVFAVVRGAACDCYERWFQLAGWQARRVHPLLGYCSWYRHYGSIDAAKLEADLEGMIRYFQEDAEATRMADDADAIRVFQIDDGYCKVGDWLKVDARKFPEGLEPLARCARESGCLPGLWVAPFVCERDSELFRTCPEWLLRDESGDPVPTGSHWSGGFALDTRNVEVRSYVLETLQTMVREWGFGLVKADFLYAACLRPHDGLNRGELMADAMDLLRTGLGHDALLLACGVPLASAFGKADYCRIGCDVGLDWDDVPHMRVLHRERVSTKNSLANTRGRALLDGRAFGNDPDVFFLRDDVGLSSAQRDELLRADAECGSVLLTSDDMSAWGEQARAQYREALRVFLGKRR